MQGCRPLTTREISLTLKFGALSARDRLLLLLCSTTGFRISEALSLKLEDVLCPDGTFQTRITVRKRNTKGKVQSRSALLHPELKAAVEGLMRETELRPGDYLFQSRKGQNKPITPTQAYRALKQAFNTLNLQGKVATHSMRKYFAGEVYEALGRDLFKTSKALGHKYVNSTAHYLSFKTEELDAAVLKILG